MFFCSFTHAATLSPKELNILRWILKKNFTEAVVGKVLGSILNFEVKSDFITNKYLKQKMRQVVKMNLV